MEGTTPVREVNRALGLGLPTDGPKTLNGLILEELQDIPGGTSRSRSATCPWKSSTRRAGRSRPCGFSSRLRCSKVPSLRGLEEEVHALQKGPGAGIIAAQDTPPSKRSGCLWRQQQRPQEGRKCSRSAGKARTRPARSSAARYVPRARRRSTPPCAARASWCRRSRRCVASAAAGSPKKISPSSRASSRR